MISIIMPVYNGEQTIEKSIESVLKQTFSQWELIVVDNGSFDQTVKKVKKYLLADKRIKLIHCDNQGVVYARKMGIDNARGEYVCFLDADDCIKSNAIDKAVAIAEKEQTDIVTFGYDIIFPNGKVESILPCISGTCTENELFDALFQPGTSGFLWNKIYKIDVLQEAIHPEGMEVCEDLYINCTLLQKHRTVYAISESFYEYYINPESVTHSFSKKIDKNNRWKYLEAYRRIEYLYIADQKKRQIVIFHSWQIIRLGLEELLPVKGYKEAKLLLLKEMKLALPFVWKSNKSLKYKLSYTKAFLYGVKKVFI